MLIIAIAVVGTFILVFEVASFAAVFLDLPTDCEEGVLAEIELEYY